MKKSDRIMQHQHRVARRQAFEQFDEQIFQAAVEGVSVVIEALFSAPDRASEIEKAIQARVESGELPEDVGLDVRRLRGMVHMTNDAYQGATQALQRIDGFMQGKPEHQAIMQIVGDGITGPLITIASASMPVPTDD